MSRGAVVIPRRSKRLQAVASAPAISATPRPAVAKTTLLKGSVPPQEQLERTVSPPTERRASISLLRPATLHVATALEKRRNTKKQPASGQTRRSKRLSEQADDVTEHPQCASRIFCSFPYALCRLDRGGTAATMKWKTLQQLMMNGSRCSSGH